MRELKYGFPRPLAVLPISRFSGKSGMIAAGNTVLRRLCSHSKSLYRRHTDISLRENYDGISVATAM
jgi:hypothetical protein